MAFRFQLKMEILLYVFEMPMLSGKANNSVELQRSVSTIQGVAFRARVAPLPLSDLANPLGVPPAATRTPSRHVIDHDLELRHRV